MCNPTVQYIYPAHQQQSLTRYVYPPPQPAASLMKYFYPPQTPPPLTRYVYPETFKAQTEDPACGCVPSLTTHNIRRYGQNAHCRPCPKRGMMRSDEFSTEP